ncbi:hypothetical protein QYE76_031333 [Lolium multiflorum]|uniref:Gag-pol polyprotein n=1 Tax=Lolium multiflorum TaxID=4521 RepID=A0AAD8QSM4_LOLMU|nr:hypothetical protein QYE76_031333 [Lolium multiflorum]
MGASNTGAVSEQTGGSEPLVPPVVEKTNKPTASPSKTSSYAESKPSSLAKGATAPPPASASKPPPAPRKSSRKGAEITAEQLSGAVEAAAAPPSGSQDQALVLHAGRAAMTSSEKVSAQLGRIVEINRGDTNLGALQRYVDKWNLSDLTDATLGVGKDKKLVVETRGPRNSMQHLVRLKQAVKELDNAWHDAHNNVLISAAKEELSLQHQGDLKAQRDETANLKDQLIQDGLHHARALKDAITAGDAKVEEAKNYMASPINFNQFLEKEKLKSNGSNFTDWFRHVRIFLNGGNLQYVLDAPLGDPPAETETDEVKNVYATRKTRYSQVQCAILCSLEADLQKRFEHHDPHELVNELKTIFETHAAVECYEASKHFFSCMMKEGSSVSEHMLAMTGHAKKLSDLGIVIPNRLGINRVLQSLPPSYKNFVMNYNMQNMNKELPELFAMLKSAEIEIKKEHQVLMVNKTTSFKKQGKSKGKNKKSGKKAATPPVKPKAGPKPDAECYYCKEKGHWKRNCSKYLTDLKSGLVKKKKEGISDIHVIDVYLTGSRTSTWVFDTGSVAHICNSKQELKNKRRLLKDEVTMRVGNGSKVDVIAVGTLPLRLPSGLVLSLNNCYFVPALSMNIISGSCLMQDGYSFKSENNGCSIFMNNIFYGRAPEKNGLFLLDLDRSDTHIHNIDAKRIKFNDNSTYMWHCRLGHIGVKRMKKLHTDGLLESIDFESLDRCEACLMGKMTKTPFSGMMERATDLLEIIHTDVCGPMSVASRGGYRYVLTFTDDLSRYGYIYLMKHKSETFEKFKEFQSEVENQRNKKIKFLRSDRGGEYLSYEFGMHLKKCGILSQLTPPGTPQRNGVSERRNRTLLDMVRSMMSLTDLPLSFWSYALETAAFTLNRAPSKSVETTPYELWFNKKPKLSFLKVWGCEAYVKKSEGKIFVAKNGTFLEKEFLTKEVTGRKVELDEIEESLLVDQSSAVPEDVPVPPTPATEEANDNDHETSNEIATEPRKSTRERATPDWYDPCLNVMIVDNNDEDPATYEEAMMSPDSNKWQEAMKSEMGSMYDNKVWTLVDLPDSRKAVENKWIFKRKTDADGNITVYKARLVAKGFRQIQGVDYDETFSPVAKLKSVRILLAIAAFFDYEIWQMDVKTAFLNGDIEEELYMVQPKDLGEASYILGIKIYRDRSRRLIGLSQSTYLDKIRKKFIMDESKKGFLPMLPGKVLSKTQGPATAEERERMSQIPYASAVGSIMYAMLCTRPDIAHAVSLTSRYQSDPGMEHWTSVKNILKYLKRTKDMFLCYGGDQELVVTSYTDAIRWASSKQCTVAKSSTESEYIAASEASSEAEIFCFLCYVILQKQFADAEEQLRRELEEERKLRQQEQEQNNELLAVQVSLDQMVKDVDDKALKFFPDSQVRAEATVAKARVDESVDANAPWTSKDHLAALYSRISHMRIVDRHLAQLPDSAIKSLKCLWPGEPIPDNVSSIADRLLETGKRLSEWRHSAARARADTALRFTCSWYEGMDRDALHNMRGDAPTNTDPAKAAARRDRAYRLAGYASTNTFMPPPPPDFEEEFTDDEEKEEEAGDGEAEEEEVVVNAPQEPAPEEPAAGNPEQAPKVPVVTEQAPESSSPLYQ